MMRPPIACLQPARRADGMKNADRKVMEMMAYHLSIGNSSIGATCWMPKDSVDQNIEAAEKKKGFLFGPPPHTVCVFCQVAIRWLVMVGRRKSCGLTEIPFRCVLRYPPPPPHPPPFSTAAGSPKP